MSSSNENIFRFAGLLCGEFTRHRWIPRTKASDAELLMFFSSVPEPTVEWTGDLRRHRSHYDDIVMTPVGIFRFAKRDLIDTEYSVISNILLSAWKVLLFFQNTHNIYPIRRVQGRCGVLLYQNLIHQLLLNKIIVQGRSLQSVTLGAIDLAQRVHRHQVWLVSTQSQYTKRNYVDRRAPGKSEYYGGLFLHNV